MKNYCDKCGNCSRCGNCCSAMIPLAKKEEKQIRNYIKENQIAPEFFQNENNINLQCCFYDREKKECKIYNVRPKICRSFKCNRPISELNKERDENHTKVYWNNIVDGKENNITDMRLLFYNDPRSLIYNLVYAITDGTMKMDEERFTFLKRYLNSCGQKELAKCMKADFYDR